MGNLGVGVHKELADGVGEVAIALSPPEVFDDGGGTAGFGNHQGPRLGHQGRITSFGQIDNLNGSLDHRVLR